MNHNKKLTLETFLKIAGDVIWQYKGRVIKNSEIAILKGVCKRQTYKEIAKDKNYCISYLSDVGSQLWRELSEALGEKVSKANARPTFERKWQRDSQSNLTHCQTQHKDCFVGFLLFTQNTYAKSNEVGNKKVTPENRQAAFQPKFDRDTKLTDEIVVQVINSLIYHYTGKHLTYFEEKIVCGIWNGEKYDDIANKIKRSHCKDRKLCGSNCKCKYSPDYLRRNIVDELWSKLSNVFMFLNYEINKDNFKPTLEQWHEKMKLSFT